MKQNTTKNEQGVMNVIDMSTIAQAPNGIDSILPLSRLSLSHYLHFPTPNLLLSFFIYLLSYHSL